jgi:hypothetical protein
MHLDVLLTPAERMGASVIVRLIGVVDVVDPRRFQTGPVSRRWIGRRLPPVPRPSAGPPRSHEVRASARPLPPKKPCAEVIDSGPVVWRPAMVARAFGSTSTGPTPRAHLSATSRHVDGIDRDPAASLGNTRSRSHFFALPHDLQNE